MTTLKEARPLGRLQRLHLAPETAKLLQLAATLLVAVYMLYIGGTFDATLRYRVQLLNTLASGALGLAWLAVRLLQRARLVRLGLEWPLAAFVLSQWLAVLTSAQPRASLDWVASVTAWSAAFLTLVDLLRAGWPRPYVLNALLLLAVLITVPSLIEIARWFAGWLAQGQWPPVTFRLTGPGGHANLTAALLNLLLPLVLARAARAIRLAGRVSLGLLAVGMLIAQFFTSSRGGWLACVAALSLFAGLLALRPGAWAAARQQVRRLRSLPALLRGAGLAAGLALLVAAGWLLALQSRHITHGSLFESRAQFWSVAWALFRAHPLTGAGPDLFAWFYPRYVSIPTGWFAPHAHSIILQVLSGSGLLGVASLLAFLVAVAVVLWRRWALAGDRVLLAGLVAGLASLAVHGLFDFILTTPFSILIVVALLALAVAEPGAGGLGRTLSPAVLAPAVIVPLAVFAFALRGAAYNEAGLIKALAGDWTAAAPTFERAAQADPGLTLYWEEAAFAYTQAGQVDLAVPLWQRAAREDPNWALFPATVAVLEHDRAAMDAAVALAPTSDLLALNRGALAEAAGDEAPALAAYVRALELKPATAEALFWQQSALRRSALAEWRATSAPPTAAVELGRQALAAGAFDQALAYFRRAAEQDPADLSAHAGLVRAYWQLGDERQAERALQAGLRLPFTTLEQTLPLRLVQADWLAAHGRRDEAMRVYGDVFSAVNQYTIIGPGTYGYADRAWTIYHRLALPADLVPQFVHADITPELDVRFAGLAQWYWDAGSLETACLILDRVYREAPQSVSGQLQGQLCP